jgi:hypothetical protein
MGFIPYETVVQTPNPVSVKLVKITERVVATNTPILELLERPATSRFDVNKTTIDDTVTMTNHTIDNKFILFSCDFVASSLSHADHIALKDVSVCELDEGPGLVGRRKLWGMYTVPQCARALWTHLR